jgi:pimeloyl-ACP methyl ester carboxylesterase
MMKVYKSEEGKRAIHASYERLVSAWGVPVEERDLPTSYGTTHVIFAGSAGSPPLILFHGVGDNSALMWLFNAQGLSRHFRMMAVDTMGGSGKSVPDERYGKGFQLPRWLGDVLDGLEVRTAYAAGVSYGCYLAQLLFTSYPERIRKFVGMAGFVAAEGYVGGKLGTMWRMMKTMMPEALFPSRANAMRIMRRLAGSNADALLSNPEVTEHFWLLMRHYNNRAQFVHMRRNLGAAEVEAMRDKSLFLIGEEDPLASFPGALRAMKYFCMNVKYFPHTGHVINHALPEKINAEIIGFLKD